jgi:hypothetical protein
MGKFTHNGKDAECITQHWDYPIITHQQTVPETFLSDTTGKKYCKPTNRTQDGKNEYVKLISLNFCQFSSVFSIYPQ